MEQEVAMRESDRKNKRQRREKGRDGWGTSRPVYLQASIDVFRKFTAGETVPSRS